MRRFAILVAFGQTFPILTGGIDLSVEASSASPIRWRQRK